MPPALTIVGIFGAVTGMSGWTLFASGTHSGDGRSRRTHNAGSTRSSAASRLPPFENATVMYKPPSFVTYDTSVTVTSNWLFVYRYDR